jgi:putative protease
MSHRDANKGDCAQSCRWKYHLVEEKRPGEYYPVVEDDHGTYFFNSKDLCMINHIPDVIDSGVKSLKIEGRNKSIYYVSNVVHAYRKAIDAYSIHGHREPDMIWLEEIEKSSHRRFTTGFYFKKPDEADQLYTSSSYLRTYDFLGFVIRYDAERGMALVEQRNKFQVGDDLEIMSPTSKEMAFKLTELYDENNEVITSAPHAKQKVWIKVPNALKTYDILRREKVES